MVKISNIAIPYNFTLVDSRYRQGSLCEKTEDSPSTSSSQNMSAFI